MKLLLWFVIVFCISTALALFEIWLEVNKKTGPWGRTYFIDPWWGKKYDGTDNLIVRGLIKIMGVQYVERYHLIVFGIGIPSIIIGIYSGLFVASGQEVSWHNIIYMHLSGMSIYGPVYVLAILVGIMLCEDFLYFALQSITGTLWNWGTRDALWRLIHGDHAWQKFLPKVCGLTLPRGYPIGVVVITCLLLLEHYLAR